MKKQNKTNHKPQRHLRTEGSLSLPPAPAKTRFCRKDTRASPWVVSVRELPVGLEPPTDGRSQRRACQATGVLGRPGGTLHLLARPHPPGKTNQGSLYSHYNMKIAPGSSE